MLKKITDLLTAPITVSIDHDHATTSSACFTSAQIAQILPEQNETLRRMFADMCQEFTDCQAIACVDIVNKQLIAVETVQCLPHEVLALVAAATTDLYTAPNLLKVIEAFHNTKDTPHAQLNEMIVNGSDTVYLLLRLPNNPNLVCVFSCINHRSTLGLLLHEARNLLPQITAVI